MPGSGAESWTLLGDDGAVVEPAERYLAYLAAIERSPNTVRAYAISLKLWFEFLAWARLDWAEVGIEDMARFVAWLRAPAPNVVVLADGAGVRRPATVNRYLAGVFGFYDHHARSGLGVAAELVAWRRVSRGSYKPFMHHVTKGKPIPVRPVKLHVPRQAPRTLEPGQIVAVLAATERLRDRFLLSLLAETVIASARRSGCAGRTCTCCRTLAASGVPSSVPMSTCGAGLTPTDHSPNHAPPGWCRQATTCSKPMATTKSSGLPS